MVTAAPAQQPPGAAAVEAPLVLRDEMAAGIARLKLNRPDAYNSLSSALIGALQTELDALAADPAVRVVVLRGAGRGFCAGHDLKEVRALNSIEAREELMADCARLMTTVVRLSKPVIAQVHGSASAAGCQLVASCDLAIATEGARFATPGVNIGLFCHTPMVALSRNVAPKHAMEMLLTGEPVDAADAVRIGLINRAVPEADLDAAVLETAGKIAGKSSYVLRIGKEAFYRQLTLDLDAAYRYASQVMVENMLAADAREGIDAFVEKRAPTWQDR